MILTLPLHHVTVSLESLFDIYFNQETDKKCWSIKKALQKVIFMKEHLLFIHAWIPCYSTSSILGKGKQSFIKVLLKSNTIRSAVIILDYWATHDKIHEAALDVVMGFCGKKFVIKEIAVSQINNTMTKGPLTDMMKKHKICDALYLVSQCIVLLSVYQIERFSYR